MLYIKRDIEDEINKYLNAREILAVVGSRQCGKTTLVENIFESLKRKGKNISKVSFDSVKELNLFENDIDSFIEIYVKGCDFLFIDEIQYSKDSGKKLKYIYDNFNIKIFISGSSAAELAIQSLKHLVGRIFVFTLYPFSFKEFLRVRNQKLLPLYISGKYKKEVASELNKYLKEFMLYGGYPRVALAKNEEEKQTILKNIYNTYLLKEIREILALSGDYKLINLIKSLSLQIGGIINYNELSTITGYPYKELKNSLNILEKTFICSQIKTFHTNKRTELVKSPKIYFYDLGFRNISFDNFSSERADMGRMYENFIFSEFVKNDFLPKYWHTKSGAEIDFILEKSNKIIPIEVKSTLSKETLTKSFYAFVEKYKPKGGYIASLDFEGKKRINGCDIIFTPLLKLINHLKSEA
ncbi:ATP-binding protein [Candidatus Woesearchaeota archaeon]|nr:ATP-binding protein [Candidatus Woesearchaeota archaeon]